MGEMGFTYYLGLIATILMIATPSIIVIVGIFSGIYKLIKNIIEFFINLFKEDKK